MVSLADLNNSGRNARPRSSVPFQILFTAWEYKSALRSRYSSEWREAVAQAKYTRWRSGSDVSYLQLELRSSIDLRSFAAFDFANTRIADQADGELA
jgi:hypothetical protein